MIDIHCHILPGVDDGPPDMATAVQMCRLAERDGTTTVVATPHMFSPPYTYESQQVRAAFDGLRAALREAGIALDIRMAAEVRMVEDMAARIERGEIPTLDGHGRYVLLEPPPVGDCRDVLGEAVFRMRLAGIVPVIAHPERVEAFHVQPELAQRTVDQGALLQVNAQSLIEGLGSDRRDDLMARLLADRLFQVVASDAHDPVHRPPLLSAAARACREQMGDVACRLLFETNPLAIIRGEPMTPLPQPDADRRGSPTRGTASSHLSRFRRFFFGK